MSTDIIGFATIDELYREKLYREKVYRGKYTNISIVLVNSLDVNWQRLKTNFSRLLLLHQKDQVFSQGAGFFQKTFMQIFNKQYIFLGL